MPKRLVFLRSFIIVRIECLYQMLLNTKNGRILQAAILVFQIS
jgi:hypothetical protein